MLHMMHKMIELNGSSEFLVQNICLLKYGNRAGVIRQPRGKYKRYLAECRNQILREGKMVEIGNWWLQLMVLITKPQITGLQKIVSHERKEEVSAVPFCLKM